MGIAKRLTAAWGALVASDKPPGPANDFWYDPAPGATSGAGVRVSSDSALSNSAVFACVRILADTVASLPLHVYRRQVRGGKERADDHPLYGVLHSSPNTWQTSFDWRSCLQGWLALRGNAFCRIVPGQRGAVDQLVPLRPDRMFLRDQLDDGRLVFAWIDDKGRQRTFFSDELFRMHGLSSDGKEGLSVVGYARESIGLAIATERFGAKLFGNGAKPGGVLEHPARLSDAARKNLRESWSMMHQGIENAHRVAILEEGLKWHQVSMTAEDSQFLATRNFQLRDIARWFRIPPPMIGDLERATFSNIEAQQIDFVVHTIRPWLTMWEQAISRDLIIASDRYFAEFSLEGLMRGDSTARAAYYKSAINDGWLTRNEVRALENRNPLDGLDDPLQPLNMQRVGEEPPEPPEPSPEPVQKQDEGARQRAQWAAERVVSKELRAIKRHAGREDFADWLGEFYTEHAGYTSEALALPPEAARAYADHQREAVMKARDAGDLDALLAAWQATRASELAAATLELVP